MTSCLICGAERRRLYKHLNSAHGLTSADYKRDYPNAVVIDTAEREKMSATMSNEMNVRWQSEDYRKRHSARMRQLALRPDIRKQRVETMGRTVKKLWQDPEHRRKIAEYSRRGFRAWSYQSSKVGKIMVQSSYEEKACALLDQDDDVETYSRGPGIPYVGLDGKSHLTFPDYLVHKMDGTLVLLEVKARYYMREPDCHLKMGVAYRYALDQGMTYEVWMEEELGVWQTN